MSDLFALARLLILSNRVALIGTGLVGTTLVVSAAMYATIDASEKSLAFVQWMVAMVCFVAGLMSLGMFSLADRFDIRQSNSGCSEWLLRMPMAAWKIAVVPIVLKFVWIALLWSIWICIFNRYNDQHVGQTQLPYLGPVFALCAASVWLLMLTWRPFRREYWRLAATIVSLILLYVLLISSFMLVEQRRQEHSSYTAVISQALPVVVFCFSVAATIHTVRLARTNSCGIVAERAGKEEHAGVDAVRAYDSPARALIHHDWLSVRSWIAKWVLFGIFPAAFVFAFMPPVVSVVGGMVMLGVIAFATVLRIGVDQQQPSQIPVYLAARPIDSATIAWTRLASGTLLASSFLSCILLVIGLIVLWPENRITWMDWSADRADEIGSNAVVSTGIRWSAVILLVLFIVILGRILSYLWIEMYGRQWVSVVVTIVGSTVALAVIAAGTFWMRRQATWEQAHSSALEYLAWAPTLAFALLAAKLIAILVAARTAIAGRHASWTAVAKLAVAWLMTVLLIGGALSSLMPHPDVGPLACFVSVMLMLPLSRIIILPACIAANRHR